jgi:hypothetical protein
VNATARRQAVIVAAIGLFGAAAVLASCSSDDASGAATTFVRLDGSPREPDGAGIVAEIAEDFSTIEIDGRTFAIAEDLQSFSSIDGSTQPLRRRLDQYVHVGLDGDTVVWIAGIGSVVTAAERDVVLYQGTVAAAADDSFAFEDGTVLELADGVDSPEVGVRVIATIDVERDLVTRLDASA